MKIFNGKSNRRGQLMIESVVSLSILVLGMAGIFTILSRSLGVTRSASNEYIGVYLASEGIEVIRALINTNYLNGRPFNDGLIACEPPPITTGCSVEYNSAAIDFKQDQFIKYDGATKLYSYSTGDNSIFKRTITIQNLARISGGDVDELKVISKVEWLDRGAVKRDVILENHLYNWR